MPAKFQAAVHKRDNATILKLSGVIDEDNDLGPLADQLHAGRVYVYAGEIERINSCGVRDWVNWLGRVEKNGGHVTLVECSPAIVAQVNLVNNFTGGGTVKSFYAPYFCPSCDREKVLLIEARDTVGQNPFHAPTCRCDECDGPMDFDDMEDSYFAFLQNTAKLETDARADEFASELTPSDAGPKLRTRTGVNLTGGTASSHTPSQQPLLSLPSVPSLPAMKKMGDGFGNTGDSPYREWPAYASVVEAMSGIYDWRFPDQSPVTIPVGGKTPAVWSVR